VISCFGCAGSCLSYLLSLASAGVLLAWLVSVYCNLFRCRVRCGLAFGEVRLVRKRDTGEVGEGGVPRSVVGQWYILVQCGSPGEVGVGFQLFRV